MFKLIYLVPSEYLEATKAAVFRAGAGRIGGYEECCYITKVKGQFKPSINASPVLGRCEQLEKIDEWCVETICPDNCLDVVVSALRRAHPYESLPLQAIKIDLMLE